MNYLILLALFYAGAAAAGTEIITGKIYPISSEKDMAATAEGPLFIQTTEVKTDGVHRRTRAVIKDADQKTVMTENAVFKDGHLVEQEVSQLQLGERYELRVRDGQTSYKVFKTGPGGKEELEKEKSEPTPPVFLTGPGFEPFVRTHGERFIRGETVSAQFGVFELARSVGFDFKSLNRTPAAQNMKILMEPSSFWLSVLVSPIHMEIDAKSMRMVKFKGRTPLRVKEGKKWKPLDAEIHYTTETVKP